MPIREKKIYSGKFLEIEIYPISKKERSKSRKRKLKESVNKQKNLNDKNARKHLRRLINGNFDDGDIFLHLTYDEKNLPGSEEEAKKQLTNFLRRVKNYRRKRGMEELKYIAVTEYHEANENDKRTRTRIHHHLVVSGMDRDELEGLWRNGRANADRLKSNELGYEELANYISKDPKGNKRWTQSRNLKQPTIKINDSKYSYKKAWQINTCQGERELLEKLYKGYSLSQYKSDVNDVNSCYYTYIKMRRRN